MRPHLPARHRPRAGARPGRAEAVVPTRQLLRAEPEAGGAGRRLQAETGGDGDERDPARRSMTTV